MSVASLAGYNIGMNSKNLIECYNLVYVKRGVYNNTQMVALNVNNSDLIYKYGRHPIKLL